MQENLTKIYEGADLSGAVNKVIYLPILNGATLTGLDVLTDEAVSGDVSFSLSLNGTELGGEDLALDEADEIVIADGTKIVSLTGLEIELVKGDEITLNLLSGAVSSPLTLNLATDDGQSSGGCSGNSDYTPIYTADFSEEIPAELDVRGSVTWEDGKVKFLPASGDGSNDTYPTLTLSDTQNLHNKFVMARIVKKPGLTTAGNYSIGLSVNAPGGVVHIMYWDLNTGQIYSYGNVGSNYNISPPTFAENTVWFRIRFESAAETGSVLHNVFYEISLDNGKNWIHITTNYVPKQITADLTAATVNLYAAHYSGGTITPSYFDEFIIGSNY